LNYPVRHQLPVTANVTCRVNSFGGTVVTADYNGVPFAEVTFDDYNVELQGYDQLTGRIDVALLGQLQDALKEAS
jgi:hypothetical protein